MSRPNLRAKPLLSAHPLYNTRMFPFFVCNHGNWDIYCDATGYCASIPTSEAAKIGCNATHFGDRAYARVVLGVDPLNAIPLT